MKKIHSLKMGIVVLFWLSASQLNAAERHSKLWITDNIIGSFNNSNVKYYVEPQIRFIDDAYKFNQFFLLVGPGYQINPDIMIFAGPGWALNKNSNGSVSHEYRFWQQLNWRLFHSHKYNLNSRTRLEERSRSNESGVNTRLRERVGFRVLLPKSDKLYLSTFDEVFFNVHRTNWVPQHFLEQNRAFLGFALKYSKSTMINMGYLNQYIRSNPIQINNVLLISVSTTI